jgi:GT2 family glycosyltransferase
MMSATVAAVGVTLNRRELLSRCLDALSRQTRAPELVIVVDNASTDGTSRFLSSLSAQMPNLEVISLRENTGGAGGFSSGMAAAARRGATWAWLMDDDALPELDSLKHLLLHARDDRNLYGSIAIQGDHLSWPMRPIKKRSSDLVALVDHLPETLDVAFIPFLGLLVSRRTIEKIGLPDEGFFIAADDVDYCERARHAGARIILVKGSKINHPASERYRLWLPGRPIYSLRLPPWKRYYDIRNRLFVARNHYGLALYYSTIPGSFLRLIATLWHEGNKLGQLKAFTGGMIDGLLGRKGRRHERWGLHP